MVKLKLFVHITNFKAYRIGVHILGSGTYKLNWKLFFHEGCCLQFELLMKLASVCSSEILIRVTKSCILQLVYFDSKGEFILWRLKEMFTFSAAFP